MTGSQLTLDGTAGKSRVGPARAVAFDLLIRLQAQQAQHSDDLLHTAQVEKLHRLDRNLCTTLVLGTLRWQILLDRELGKLLTRNTKLDVPVRIALRLGAFQLLFLDRVPDHSVVDESVELTKRAGHRFASSMVNAVLRKLAAQTRHVANELRTEDAVPDWLHRKWQKAFGFEAAKLICDYQQEQPALVIRAREEDLQTLESDGFVMEQAAFLSAARKVKAGDLRNSTIAQPSSMRVQDEGSQLIAELVGGGHHAHPHSILDCCAAPGGKTAILAERFPAAKIRAIDISKLRIRRMQEEFAKRADLSNVTIGCEDVLNLSGSSRYDLILCDAPCSGTGTLARNPEIKVRLSPDDLMRHQNKQVGILRAALQRLAPGGRLLYSTCSIEMEENEIVVQKVLQDLAGVRTISIRSRIEEMSVSGQLSTSGAALLLRRAVKGDYLQTLPGVLPCDGFFAALVERVPTTEQQ